jgi:hypothetical protein
MGRQRRALGFVAALYLISRTATLAFVPAELWLSAAEASKLDCRCARGTVADCPMHHSQTSDTRHCTLRSSLPANDLGMLSLLSIDGYLTPAFALFGSQATSAPRPAFVTPFASRFVPPDPPPPRA